MRQNDRDYTITKTAVFADKTVEEEFYSYEIFRTLPIVRRMVLICAILFFAVAAYDIVYFDFAPSRYLHSVASRAIGLTIGLAFFFCTPKIRRAQAITSFLTVFELSIILGYIYILFSQRAQGYTEQAMTIMLMILCIYMFPNHWINLLLTSILPVALFLLLGPYYVDGLSDTLRIELTIIFIATITLASAYFHLQNRTKRKQYAESCIRALMSSTDRLTSIYNRSKFDDELAAWCEKSADGQSGFCIILIDIDHFKAVNDTYGHIVGDEVLVNMTLAISACIRSDDIFARWGGEEFAILMPDCGIGAAGALATRLKEVIENKQFDTVGRVTISIGVVAYADGDTPISIMQRVDRALYQSKNRGRNTVTVFWGETVAAAEANRDMEPVITD